MTAVASGARSPDEIVDALRGDEALHGCLQHPDVFDAELADESSELAVRALRTRFTRARSLPTVTTEEHRARRRQ